jgi:ribonuclease T2
MQDFWKDYQGDDEDFWEHEFNKHGTCMSSLEPRCYPAYQPADEVVDYFKRAVQAFKRLPSYQWLADAGIVPSQTATYTLAQIQAALESHHGHDVIINCSGKELNELWYHYNVRGSIQSGEFVAADPVGSPSTCPATGIKYLPKYATTTPSPTPTSSAVPTPVPSGVLSGKGRLYVKNASGASDGFLISGGKWYRAGGTPATYTATPDASGSTFTMETSKGKCAVQADASLLCAASVADSSSFGWDGTYLTYEGASTFYATETPSGQAQGTVYTTPQAVSFKVTWTAS